MREPPGERKPESGARLRACGGGARADTRFEDRLLLVALNAWTVVDDIENGCRAVAGEGDRRPAAPIAHSVLEQRPDDLGKQLDVDADAHRPVRELDDDLDVLQGRERSDLFDSPCDGVPGVTRRTRQAGLLARRRNKGVDGSRHLHAQQCYGRHQDQQPNGDTKDLQTAFGSVAVLSVTRLDSGTGWPAALLT